MDKLDNETNELINIVNRNAEQKRKEAYEKSIQNENIKKIQYQKRKQRKQKAKIKQAIAVILTIATLTSTVALTNHFTSTHYEDNNAIISTVEASDIINQKIEQYEKLMNMYSDKENSIETVVGRDFNTQNYEALVSYNENNLANHINEAAKVSETEARCVIIAAYRIINEPYRDTVINSALSKASSMQEDNYNYKIPENTQKFLEQQGYENWEEYNMNERNNIKELYAIEQHINIENRKGV